MFPDREIRYSRQTGRPGLAGAAAFYTLTLIAVGALLVHALTYAFAGGPHDAAPEAHSYLPPLLPSLILAFVLASGALLVGLAIAARTKRSVAGGSVHSLWLRCALGLIAIYFVQETFEEVLTTGGLPASAELLGGANSLSLVFSVVIALCIALLRHGAGRAIEAAAGGNRIRLLRPFGERRWTLPTSDIVRLDAVARRLAPRGPPVARI